MSTQASAYRIHETKIAEEAAFLYTYKTDQALLDQYYQLRESCYKKDWGLTVFSGAEDKHDRSGHILVVRSGDMVIGGGRVYFRQGSASNDRLPMETDQFRLHEVFPEMNSDRKVIGEIGRVAVLPAYRGGKLSKIGLYLLAKAQQHACQYLTMVAPVQQAVRYKKLADSYGIDFQIVDNVPVADHPYYNHIEMRLLVGDIKDIPDFRFLLESETGLYSNATR